MVLETTASFAKVDKLEHAFVFLPDQERDVYVVYLLSQTASAEVRLFKKETE